MVMVWTVTTTKQLLMSSTQNRPLEKKERQKKGERVVETHNETVLALQLAPSHQVTSIKLYQGGRGGGKNRKQKVLTLGDWDS